MLQILLEAACYVGTAAFLLHAYLPGFDDVAVTVTLVDYAFFVVLLRAQKRGGGGGGGGGGYDDDDERRRRRDDSGHYQETDTNWNDVPTSSNAPGWNNNWGSAPDWSWPCGHTDEY
jgi:hypothetical protein